MSGSIDLIEAELSALERAAVELFTPVERRELADGVYRRLFGEERPRDAGDEGDPSNTTNLHSTQVQSLRNGGSTS